MIGRYAVQVNGLDCLAVTKLDVWMNWMQSGVRPTGWTENASSISPAAPRTSPAAPIFETLGWQCSTEDCRKLEDLPDAAMAYLRFLADR